MGTYGIQNDIIYTESDIDLALYKIINSYIEAQYVFYDSSAIDYIKFDNTQDAIDYLYLNRLTAGTAIRIDDDNRIHGDYKAGNAIRIDDDPETGEPNIISGNYVGSGAVQIDGNKISLTYQAGVGILIDDDDAIHADYKAGVGIKIIRDVIYGDYQAGNALLLNENHFRGNYKEGNAIRIDGDTIHGDYKAGNAIRIDGDTIHGDYKAGNAVIINQNKMYGDYKAGVGVHIKGDEINLNYRAGLGIRIIDDTIYGDYRAGVGVRIDDDVIHGDYKAGVGVDILGNVIQANYIGTAGIDITGEVISGVYRGGTAIEIYNDVIHGAYRSGTAIRIDGDTIHGDYSAGIGISISGDVISGDYRAGNAINISGDVISGAYQGGNGISVIGNVISGDYKGGNAIYIDRDVIHGNYIGGVGVDITGETISGDYKEGVAIRIMGNNIFGAYQGGNAIIVDEDVIHGDYKAGNAIYIEDDVIYGDYKAGNAIIVNGNVISGNYQAGNAVSISGSTISGAYQAGNAIRIDGDVIHGDYVGGNGVEIAGNVIRGNYVGGNAIVVAGNVIRGDYRGGGCVDGGGGGGGSTPPPPANCPVTTPDPLSFLHLSPTVISDFSGGEQLWAAAYIEMNGFNNGSPGNAVFNQDQYLKARARYANYMNRGNRTDWGPAEILERMYATGHASAQAHFEAWGWKEACNPSDSFDVIAYIEEKTKHLNATGYNGRNTNTHADTIRLFIDMNMSPLTHYLSHGQSEGLQIYGVQNHKKHNVSFRFGPQSDMSKPFFVEEEYLQFKARHHNSTGWKGKTDWTWESSKAEILTYHSSVYEHFCLHGWQEGVAPSNNFDVCAYIIQRAATENRHLAVLHGAPQDIFRIIDMMKAFQNVSSCDPLQHFLQWGNAEFSPWTNTNIIPTAVHPENQVTPGHLLCTTTEVDTSGFGSGCIRPGCGISVSGNVISLNRETLDIYRGGVGIKIDADKVIHGDYHGGTRIKIENEEISLDLQPGPGLLVCDGEISLDPSVFGCCIGDA